MSAWLRQHALALRVALARLMRAAGMLSALVIGVALSLPAGGYVLLDSLRTLAGRLTLDPQVSVFLKPDIPRPEATALAAGWKRDPRVLNVRFVPREAAIKELAAVQGMPEVIAALGRNPLPDAYVLNVQGDLEALAAEARKLPEVAHVQADSAWVSRLAALAGIGRLAVWLLASLLCAGLVAVTFNTIRLQILTQREEIEVSKLIGATDAFIRRPFYYFGLLQGAAGGLLALAIVSGGLWLLNREVGILAASYGSTHRLEFLSVADALALMSFAGLIGWLGAYLSVNRHLREMEPG